MASQVDNSPPRKTQKAGIDSPLGPSTGSITSTTPNAFHTCGIALSGLNAACVSIASRILVHATMVYGALVASIYSCQHPKSPTSLIRPLSWDFMCSGTTITRGRWCLMFENLFGCIAPIATSSTLQTDGVCRFPVGT